MNDFLNTLGCVRILLHQEHRVTRNRTNSLLIFGYNDVSFVLLRDIVQRLRATDGFARVCIQEDMDLLKKSPQTTVFMFGLLTRIKAMRPFEMLSQLTGVTAKL
ncbi:MAG: hypothetical protein CL607_01155 [Anaerolineaceae bacterium]|nr:hypothetical protein [Anaerolineaceae bacterium]